MPLSYRLNKASSKGSSPLYTGRLANISGAGIFVRTIHVLPPGSEVDLEIVLEGKKPKHMHGTVLWVADKSLQPKLHPGMGIQFTELTQHGQEEIIEFIEKHIVHREG